MDPSKKTSGKKVLIVEDELFLRDLYVEVLTGAGYQVDSAADGEEGMTKIKAGGYNLILLDIILPKMNGLDIMRTLKSDPAQKISSVVIFLTNLDKDEEIKAALELGNGYLIKSQITPATLVEEVKRHLS